ncbi:MAG: CtsR family transcriptional regulator [Oscillospiraceae bacterium]|nr:CtsR family transcriptional regulator [Oscillospiraceae bacterium]
MGLCDDIACLIDELLRSEDVAEFGRAELAGRVGCVPSQINYVIATRFSPERGFAVESRRGGGGYIRIRRVAVDAGTLVMHTVNAVGDEIDLRSCAALTANLRQSGAIPEGAERLILAAIGNNALREVPPETRDTVRAAIFKQILINV